MYHDCLFHETCNLLSLSLVLGILALAAGDYGNEDMKLNRFWKDKEVRISPCFAVLSASVFVTLQFPAKTSLLCGSAVLCAQAIWSWMCFIKKCDTAKTLRKTRAAVQVMNRLALNCSAHACSVSKRLSLLQALWLNCVSRSHRTATSGWGHFREKNLPLFGGKLKYRKEEEVEFIGLENPTVYVLIGEDLCLSVKRNGTEVHRQR